MDRRVIGSWMSGPRAAMETTEVEFGYPGQRLGLPKTGAGSVAPFGRRFLAVFVDWMLCLLISGAFLRNTGWTPVALGVENLLLVGTLGFGIGGRLASIRVSRLDGGAPSPVAVLIRTVLLCLAVPALIWDRDGRGLHDKLAGTVVVRFRGQRRTTPYRRSRSPG